jgi:hypothetical protein
MSDAITGASEMLLDKAEQAIATGRLPGIPSTRVWGGPGSGQCCDLCGDTIAVSHTEIELEDATGSGGIRFHVNCHQLWQRACDRLIHEHGSRGECQLR